MDPATVPDRGGYGPGPLWHGRLTRPARPENNQGTRVGDTAAAPIPEGAVYGHVLRPSGWAPGICPAMRPHRGPHDYSQSAVPRLRRGAPVRASSHSPLRRSGSAWAAAGPTSWAFCMGGVPRRASSAHSSTTSRAFNDDCRYSGTPSAVEAAGPIWMMPDGDLTAAIDQMAASRQAQGPGRAYSRRDRVYGSEHHRRSERQLETRDIRQQALACRGRLCAHAVRAKGPRRATALPQ